jgi:hypothetical protein
MVGESLYRVLGRRVHALQRHRIVGQLAAEVDDRFAIPAHLIKRNQRAVHHAPEIGLQQPFLVSQWNVLMTTIDRHTRVVHPDTDAAKALHGSAAQRLDVVAYTDVGRQRHGIVPLPAQLINQLVER